MNEYLKDCRSGIFKEADKLIDHVIWYCKSKIEEDLGNKEFQIEGFTGIKCEDSYHEGYDNALRMTIVVLEDIRKGHL